MNAKSYWKEGGHEDWKHNCLPLKSADSLTKRVFVDWLEHWIHRLMLSQLTKLPTLTKVIVRNNSKLEFPVHISGIQKINTNVQYASMQHEMVTSFTRIHALRHDINHIRTSIVLWMTLIIQPFHFNAFQPSKNARRQFIPLTSYEIPFQDMRKALCDL